MTTIKITLLMLIICHFHCMSQDMYIILTSQTRPQEVNDIPEGIIRSSSSTLDPLYKYPTINFKVKSRSKQIFLYFTHNNFNLTELIKIRPVQAIDQMEILVKPISFLQTINPIDMDLIFPQMTKAQADVLGNSFIREKIYIIDRKDIQDGNIKLIQVFYRNPHIDIPENINLHSKCK